MGQQKHEIAAIIAEELKVNTSQVEAAIQLLDEDATVPFIARYRKEKTGFLDDTQLRVIAERLLYIRELNTRRAAILESIREQKLLTPELELNINEAVSKTRLEDLYLPYRPKRRTKAMLAKEAGLEPLAQGLVNDPNLVPETEAQKYITNTITDIKEALEGARQILMEKFAEDANLIQELRDYIWQNASLFSKINPSAKKETAAKYKDYFSYNELLKKIPSHRALALFRGRRESVLQISIQLTDENYGPAKIAQYFTVQNKGRAADMWLLETIRLAWKTKLITKLELELLSRLREAADNEAIKVFARNLRDLLLAAPAGPKITIGLDPGIRTGVKVVVADNTGKVLDYSTIYPFQPNNDWHAALAELAKLAAKYQVSLIAIGNGTGSRDTERLVGDLIKMYPDLQLAKVLVSEAGASVYSASAQAAAEFPDIDVSIRGAVSIARRLQDPLAELVKIDPKSIGVGQYQHDVNQNLLARSLTGVVEDCVNFVGVDVNTASVPLLTRVSGLNEKLAENLVEYRDSNGAFTNREQLKNIARMGEKTFQQAAGFLRIIGGDNPLDSSAVHPEAYPLVEKILANNNMVITEIMANPGFLHSVNAAEYVDNEFSLTTINDVLKELEKPGRDPRGSFKTVSFKEGVEDIKDLQVGMILEGVVSNVTNFGAFVDIGVHQDGLVHISAMTNRFISDPHAIVKAGEIVKVRVTELDIERRRIGLSMNLEPQAKKAEPVAKVKSQPIKNKPAKPKAAPAKMIFNTSMADALAKLKRGS